MQSIYTGVVIGSSILAFWLNIAIALSADVKIRLVDPGPGHVHAPEKPFTLDVEASDPGLPEAKVYAQWVDMKSSPLGPAIELPPEQSVELRSPGAGPGYWGLFFFSNDKRVAFPPQTAGFPSQEYGFAVLPPRTFSEGRLEPDSFYGMVHPNIGSDPFLVGGAKTLSWNTTGARWWHDKIRRVREANLEELPIVSGPTWESDDSRPISLLELAAIEKKFHAYLSAAPDVDEWELGREENVGKAYDKTYYFENLAAKAKRMRQVADAINRSVRFIYQFANFKTKKIRKLIDSGALKHFQILSLHPYRWPDFPSPETWFSREVKTLRTLLAQAGYEDMEIWITEIGLPVRGNRDPKGFFGYPKPGRQVPGVTRDYAARYLVKCHAFAALEGIRRVYVYNYQDRANDIRAAEDHFGLRSYTGDKTVLGFPKQAYVAYVRMLHELAGRKLVRLVNPRANTYVFDYQAPDGQGRLLGWVYPEGTASLAWEELLPTGSQAQVTRVVDLYGGSIKAWDGNAIKLTETPVYVEYQKAPAVGGRAWSSTFLTVPSD